MDAHHAEVGAYLLSAWDFPNSIVEAVAFHHAPSQAAAGGSERVSPSILPLMYIKHSPSLLSRHLENSTAAASHASKWIVRDDHRQPGLFRQQFIDVAQQGTPA
jgi:HD-like signal output (HDOD) protein